MSSYSVGVDEKDTYDSPRGTRGPRMSRIDNSGTIHVTTGKPRSFRDEDSDLEYGRMRSFRTRLETTLLFAPTEEEKTFEDVLLVDVKNNKVDIEKPMKSSTQLRGAQTIEGRKIIQFKVLSLLENTKDMKMLEETAQVGETIDLSKVTQPLEHFAPRHLLDIESGNAIVVSNYKFIDHHEFEEVGDEAAVVVTAKAKQPTFRDEYVIDQEQHGQSLQEKINAGDIRDFGDDKSELKLLERLRVGPLRQRILMNLDEINSLRLSRRLQFYLPYLSIYDSYILSQLIQALEGSLSAADTLFVLRIAFKNRSIYRILKQITDECFDFSVHDYQRLCNGRFNEISARIPLVGTVPPFPTTENLISTREYISWMWHGIWSGKKEFTTKNGDSIAAQNLSAEINGFELANRLRFGTYIGRLKTNEFRSGNRFPTDDLIVASFLTHPLPTMIDNGAVHTLRQLAKHWRKMLSNDNVHFASCVNEQLDPFETMRVHIPAVCIALSSIRGHNNWDNQVLGPFVKKCQELKPSFTADGCRNLILEMRESIMSDLCAGVASVFDPLSSWLESLMKACTLIEQEAKEVYEKITSVEIGLRLGHDFISQVNWDIPSDEELESAMVSYMRGENPGEHVMERNLHNAIELMTPRDKETLLGLVKSRQVESNAFKLLFERFKALLKRELHRDLSNEAIRHLSQGVYTEDLLHDGWYWLKEGEKVALYRYDKEGKNDNLHRFVHIDSDVERFVNLARADIKIRTYIPIAEAIMRAQKCYMDIELQHGKTFRYNAFMEFSFLRSALRQICVISQIFCEELDEAHIRLLREVQRLNLELIKVKTPQNTIVIGGDLTALMTLIHSTENVLASGGVMKLYKVSEELMPSGSVFEKSRIIRLDMRWAAMLRYYLGTTFEDVFIPTNGIDGLLGNTLPTQGYLEITKKDLENMLHVCVTKMWSKGLVECIESNAYYDSEVNALTTRGEDLKLGDSILRRIDPNGKRIEEQQSWKIVNLIHMKPLELERLKPGAEYAVYIRHQDAVFPFKLSEVNVQTRTYTFTSLQEGVDDVKVSAHMMPAVYRKGTKRHAGVENIVLECTTKNSSGYHRREEIAMKKIRKAKFILDIDSTHVIQSTGSGKLSDSRVHLSTTSSETYGVCCLQGLKISMAMHNFGITVGNTQTKTVGDYTKMIRLQAVVSEMVALTRKKNWRLHFLNIIEDSGFPKIQKMSAVFLEKVVNTVKSLSKQSKTFRRQTLHIRIFETIDHFCLGMEFSHGFENWKAKSAETITSLLSKKAKNDSSKKIVEDLKESLIHHMNRLWFQACLHVLQRANVYSGLLPKLHLIKSYTDQDLGKLQVGDAFRFCDKPSEKYEVIHRKTTNIYEKRVKEEEEYVYARNIQGKIYKMQSDAQVRRESDLTRAPNGNDESDVAILTFPVEQFVHFRTAQLQSERRIVAYVGEEKVTPHFMRSNEFTGFGLNAMLLNDFLKSGIDEANFSKRLEKYCVDTDCLSGDILTSGIGSNCAFDGFLRLGFSYSDGLNYLYARILECTMTGRNIDAVLPTDWKSKFAASMVPRGMELNKAFIDSLADNIRGLVFDKFITNLGKGHVLQSEDVVTRLKKRKVLMDENNDTALDPDAFWANLLSDSEYVVKDYGLLSKHLEKTVSQIILVSKDADIYNNRTPSEFFSQPKPVDSIASDVSMEAQYFADILVTCAAISSFGLSLVLLSNIASGIFAIGLAAVNVFLTACVMVNASRYKIRLEELRSVIFKENFRDFQKAVFSLLDEKDRTEIEISKNPFYIDLDERVRKFRIDVAYYGLPKPNKLLTIYEELKGGMNDPSSIHVFQQKLCKDFIADTYHENSHLQESLAKIHKVCDDMRSQIIRSMEMGITREGSTKAKSLHIVSTSVAPRLEKSILAGGYVMRLLKGARFLSAYYKHKILRREICDLQNFYYATRESQIALLVFIIASLIHLSSWVLIIAQILDLSSEIHSLATEIAFWASLTAGVGSIIAILRLLRKSWKVSGLWYSLERKVQNISHDEDKINLSKLKMIAFTHVSIALVLITAALAASVALAWNVALLIFPEEVEGVDLGWLADDKIALYVALGANFGVLFSFSLSLIVQYDLEYDLSPRLGEHVCEAYRDEIETIYKASSIPSSDGKRKAWEYVAREFCYKYPFDSILTADRFGSILQYLQSGMDPRSHR